MRKMNFQATMDSFAWQKIEVLDTLGEYIDGVWVENRVGETRFLRGVPFAMKPEELEFYAEGSASAGGISLITAGELFWSDINALGQIKKQSYIIWQGYRWRVVGNNLMVGNVDKLLIFNAIRYIE